MTRFAFKLGMAGLLAISVTSGQSLAAVNLAGHWKLDESAGATTAYDSSPNGLDGIYQSGAAAGASGVAGNAVDLSTGAVTLPASPAIGDLTNDFSVAVWVNLDEVPPTTTGRVFTPADPNGFPGGGFSLGVEDGAAASPGHGKFTTHGVQDYVSDDLVMPTNEWVHYAAVMDANNDVTFYFNGQKQDTISGSGPADSWSAGFAIGSYIGGGQLNGQVDDVQVYDGALTDAQVSILFENPGVAVPEPGSLALLACGGLACLARRRRA